MKIVFILGSLHMQRCMKRIDEFVENGYDVDAYGFDCGVGVELQPQTVKVNVLGKMDLSWNHFVRERHLYQGIRKVVKRYSSEKVLYYVFGLDKGILFRFIWNKPYIYEESDLVHTYRKNNKVVQVFEWLDKQIIKKAFLSVFTSEGFLKYHYGNARPDNAFVIANRLPISVNNLQVEEKKQLDISNLSIGFVGFIRFNSIFNFAKVIGEKCPDVTFHFFGTTNSKSDECLFKSLNQYKNIIFHGAFKHPTDLPSIYSQLDLVLSTYDVVNENVRYAEPNKIYEAIWFKTPIIVASGTFLADKVEKLGIGFDIDPLNDDSVKAFITKIDKDAIEKKIKAIEEIDPNYALNENQQFFEILKRRIEESGMTN